MSFKGADTDKSDLELAEAKPNETNGMSYCSRPWHRCSQSSSDFGLGDNGGGERRALGLDC